MRQIIKNLNWKDVGETLLACVLMIAALLLWVWSNDDTGGVKDVWL